MDSNYKITLVLSLDPTAKRNSFYYYIITEVVTQLKCGENIQIKLHGDVTDASRRIQKFYKYLIIH